MRQRTSLHTTALFLLGGFIGSPAQVEAQDLAKEPAAAVRAQPRGFRIPLGFRGPRDQGPSSRVQVQFGEDNPFLDIRRPGEPGGFGFQRLNTQLQLFDNGTTELLVGLQALRPSGIEFDGLQEGPTIVSPAVGVARDLGQGLTLQGFVGKSLRPGAQWGGDLDRDLQYGMALHTPLSVDRNSGQSVCFVVEALGRYRHELDATRASPRAWELLPGIHWRRADSWWLSGGVLMPVGSRWSGNPLLQITCSWRY